MSLGSCFHDVFIKQKTMSLSSYIIKEILYRKERKKKKRLNQRSRKLPRYCIEFRKLTSFIRVWSLKFYMVFSLYIYRIDDVILGIVRFQFSKGLLLDPPTDPVPLGIIICNNFAMRQNTDILIISQEIVSSYWSQFR